MDPLLTPLPSVEPTVVLVDASPLIHLAMLDALDLPLRFRANPALNYQIVSKTGR